MSRIGGRRTAGLGITLAFVLALALPGSVAAASARFGEPTATSTWGTGVEFVEPVVLERDATRVELLLDATPWKDDGLFVVDLGRFDRGSVTLRHTVEASEGFPYPNTRFLGRWRVTYADGTSELGPPASATYADTRFDWRTLEGVGIRIHWYDGDRAFARRVLAVGEQALADLSSLLGAGETAPIDFFVYSSADDFNGALGFSGRENAAGQAVTDTRTLYARITPTEAGADWIADVVPHELAHLSFATAADNFLRAPPLWLDEGVATYLAEGYDIGWRGYVADAIDSGTLLPVTSLVVFPRVGERQYVSYAVSVSAVDFLVRRFGDGALVTLIRSYGRGLGDDGAFRAAIGLSVAEFEAAWLADLGVEPPGRYGPNEAERGPIPPGWSGPGGGSSSAEGGGADAASPPPSSPSDADATGSLGLDASIAFGVAVLLAGAVAILLIAARGRRRRADGADPGVDPS